MGTENLKIWDAVSQTDVDHTKQVDFGRKFTAIDAHSQVMNATEQFGPVGAGWGYKNEYGEVHLQDGKVIVYCDVTLWYITHDEWEGNKIENRKEFGPIRGGSVLIKSNKDGSIAKVPDTDAWKKASTDGLTKALSHLGFNADVFLGMFDDNKYVTGLQKEKDETETAAQQLYAEERAGFIKKVEACKSKSAMDGVLADYKLWIDRLPPGTAVELRGWVEKKKGELSGSK